MLTLEVTAIEQDSDDGDKIKVYFWNEELEQELSMMFPKAACSQFTVYGLYKIEFSSVDKAVSKKK